MKRVTPWLFAALVAAVGCRDDQQPLTAGNLSDRLTVGLEVSARTAAPGDRVVIAVRADAALDEPLQGVQASLRFDPSRLAYVGQSVGGNLVLVNDAGADHGVLRLIAVDANGLAPRVASLVFTAKGGDLTSGLRLQFEGAASLHAELIRAGSRTLAVAQDLSAGDVARLSAADWMSRLAPNGFKAWQEREQGSMPCWTAQA